MGTIICAKAVLYCLYPDIGRWNVLSKEFVTSRIKELMEIRKMSRYSLAKKAGIKVSTLSDILQEKRKAQISTIQKICDAFDISLSLFFYEGSDFQKKECQERILKGFSLLTESEQKLVLDNFLR